jgi:hypothetical protein
MAANPAASAADLNNNGGGGVAVFHCRVGPLLLLSIDVLALLLLLPPQLSLGCISCADGEHNYGKA